MGQLMQGMIRKGDVRTSLLSETWHRFETASVLQAMREVREELAFTKLPNAVRGRFANFADAMQSAPEGARLGHDSPGAVTSENFRLDHLTLADYPLAFWLSHFLPKTKRVFDLGGHTGLLYYGYTAKLTLPEGLEWLVCEVPTLVEAGRKLAVERSATGLSFTGLWHEGDGADLMVASGVLQYLDWTLPDCIEAFHRRPRVVLVNATPMYDGESFVTLEHAGDRYFPCRVFNQDAFITAFERLGYRILDQWKTGRPVHVPLHPEISISSERGIVFEHR